ncbi:LAG3 protein, partial [Ramphastos sulfuratus]|nr:LAG3 protein [Ramphastos sulfuratus]
MRPRVSVQDSALRSGNFSLRISPVRSGDAGLYEARVGYNAEVRSCRVQLGVITVSLSQPSPVVENEPLLLSCSSSHRASLVETCWFHNGRGLPASRNFCFSHGAHFVLRPAMSDDGYWHCQLRYSNNEVVSATYNLRVLGNGPSNSIVYAAAGSAAD